MFPGGPISFSGGTLPSRMSSEFCSSREQCTRVEQGLTEHGLGVPDGRDHRETEGLIAECIRVRLGRSPGSTSYGVRRTGAICRVFSDTVPSMTIAWNPRGRPHVRSGHV